MNKSLGRLQILIITSSKMKSIDIVYVKMCTPYESKTISFAF